MIVERLQLTLDSQRFICPSLGCIVVSDSVVVLSFGLVGIMYYHNDGLVSVII